MGKLLFELTDDERAALERVRIKLGARSHAETLRKLIVAGDEAPTVTMSIGRKVSPVEVAREPGKALKVSLPYAGDIKRKPMPKGTTKR